MSSYDEYELMSPAQLLSLLFALHTLLGTFVLHFWLADYMVDAGLSQMLAFMDKSATVVWTLWASKIFLIDVFCGMKVVRKCMGSGRLDESQKKRLKTDYAMGFIAWFASLAVNFMLSVAIYKWRYSIVGGCAWCVPTYLLQEWYIAYVTLALAEWWFGSVRELVCKSCIDCTDA